MSEILPEALLPCPFCGGVVELDAQHGYAAQNGKRGSEVAIYCTKCDAGMYFPFKDYQEYSQDDLIEMARTNWNRRDISKITELEKEIERMEKALLQFKELYPNSPHIIQLVGEALNGSKG